VYREERADAALQLLLRSFANGDVADEHDKPKRPIVPTEGLEDDFHVHAPAALPEHRGLATIRDCLTAGVSPHEVHYGLSVFRNKQFGECRQRHELRHRVAANGREGFVCVADAPIFGHEQAFAHVVLRLEQGPQEIFPCGHVMRPIPEVTPVWRGAAHRPP
jgi:hypothetical protein